MLVEALRNGESVEKLLISGENPNNESSWMYPIVVAIEMGNQAAVDCLMRYGADVFEPYEDVAALAISNPIMVWTILNHAPLTVKHHIFGTMQRLGKEDLMIEFIMKGYADLGFRFDYSPHFHVTPWKFVPEMVKEVFVERNKPWSRKRHRLFSSEFQSVVRTFCLCRLRSPELLILPVEMVEAIFQSLRKF